MAALKPVKLVSGDCWRRTWRLQQLDGAPVDLAGASARLHVRDSAGTKVAEASTANGRIAITPGQGLIEMTVPAAATGLPPGSYRYALEITYANGCVETVETNTLVVLEDITRD